MNNLRNKEEVKQGKKMENNVDSQRRQIVLADMMLHAEYRLEHRW